MRRFVAALLAGAAIASCGSAMAQGTGGGKSLALVTNVSADFWTIARARRREGAEASIPTTRCR